MGILCLLACTLALPSYAENAVSEVNNFQQNKDGTASAIGTVVGEWHGCEVDGSCGVWLLVGKQKIGLITSEGDVECKNKQAAEAAAKIKRDQRVKAYGAYKNGKISFCGSKDFYIVPEN